MMLFLWDIDGTLLRGGVLWKKSFIGALTRCYPNVDFKPVGFVSYGCPAGGSRAVVVTVSMAPGPMLKSIGSDCPTAFRGCACTSGARWANAGFTAAPARKAALSTNRRAAPRRRRWDLVRISWFFICEIRSQF